MAAFGSIILFMLLSSASLATFPQFIAKLDKVSEFTLRHYAEINFDGLLGFVIAEAQILQAIQLQPQLRNLQEILHKFHRIRQRILPILPVTPAKMPILEKFLLRPENWITDGKFLNNSLKDLGIYANWTKQTIIKNKHAEYKGVPSDHCLMEILRDDCYMSSFCKEMMLAPRIDHGYLLTHRLFYLQIIRLKPCLFDAEEFRTFTGRFCSLILKEARTSDHLDFPVHDIFIEQMVLCGLEGYQEFLTEDWSYLLIDWQTEFGCYKSKGDYTDKRSTNVISFGCTDHTTGLGAAALGLIIRNKLYWNKNN